MDIGIDLTAYSDTNWKCFSQKTRTDKEKQVLQTKIGKLESLCRALQGELHGKKAASPQPASSGGKQPSHTC